MIRKPACSIVIRAYNEERHIRRLLEGITEQTIRDVQIILVDSGSTDGTVEVAKEFPVEIISISPENFTFGRSLNLGISAAKADLVVMASAHVYPVYPDWLERLLEPFGNKEIGLTYGKQRGTHSSHFSEQQIFKHWYPDTSFQFQDYPFCNNANAAIRRELWEEHPYDETLPGLEDLEWGKWAQSKGYGISYVPEAEIIHVHSENQKGILNRYRREGMAFKRIYPQERFGRADLVRLFYHNSIDDLKAAWTQGVFWQNLFLILRFRWAQFYGTYIGYRQSGPLTWGLRQAFYYPRTTAGDNPESKRPVEPIQYSKIKD
jgi:glycosyltransferase involved in cell wall biosynthesis